MVKDSYLAAVSWDLTVTGSHQITFGSVLTRHTNNRQRQMPLTEFTWGRGVNTNDLQILTLYIYFHTRMH